MTKWSALLWVIFSSWVLMAASDAPGTNPPFPILVELFTSEGCSSCPPADALLEHMDHFQDTPGAQLIVLSEHVDYWNHIGWKDPYSSSFFSKRQSEYANRFGLDSVYTPQMVVDGATEFLGSDSLLAKQAIDRARSQQKVAVRVSAVSLEDPSTVRAHVEVGPSESSTHGTDIYVAIALNHAESQVRGGENEGRRLTHVAVVQSLTKVGSLGKGKAFSQDVRLKLSPGADPANLRLIVLAQESGQGRVQGAALQQLAK